MISGVFIFGQKYLLDAAIFSALVANIFYLFIGFQNVNNVRFYWDFGKIKSLVGVGIPLILYSLSDKVFTSLDRFMIANLKKKNFKNPSTILRIDIYLQYKSFY